MKEVTYQNLPMVSFLGPRGPYFSLFLEPFPYQLCVNILIFALRQNDVKQYCGVKFTYLFDWCICFDICVQFFKCADT